MNSLEGVDTTSCTVVLNCSIPTDVTLISSDGKPFPTHSQNLGEFTGGFPVGITPVNREEVRIPELDAEALKLFLWYVHPSHRQPCLDEVKFGTLMKLAEAVEKYEVFPAMEVCRLKISQFANSSRDGPYLCVEIFQYASKHGYRALMDDTAFIAVQSKYRRREMESLNFRRDIREAWDRYTKSWFDLFEDCYNPPPPVLHKGAIPECNRWKKFRNVVIHNVKQGAIVLSRFHDIVDDARRHLHDCRHCERRADTWVGKAYKDISLLKKFSYHMY